jgi:hypothetical protein
MHKSCITNKARKISHWKFSMKKSPKGVLLASDGTEIEGQDQTISSAFRLIGRDHSIYSIPATHAKLAGKSQLSFLVSAEKDTQALESCEDVLPKMLCRTLHWAVF